MSSLRRAGTVAATAVALVVLAGCAAGYDAPTNTRYGPSDGSNANAGSILIRNALLVADGTDGTTAGLVAAFVNQGQQADKLTGLAVEKQQTQSTLPADGLEVPPGGLVSIGGDGGPSVTVYAKAGSIDPGDYVTLDLEFEKAGIVSLPVLVSPKDGPFADVQITPEGGTASPSTAPSPTST